jgi:hypothetical protein
MVLPGNVYALLQAWKNAVAEVSLDRLARRPWCGRREARKGNQITFWGGKENGRRWLMSIYITMSISLVCSTGVLASIDLSFLISIPLTIYVAVSLLMHASRSLSWLHVNVYTTVDQAQIQLAP